MAMMSDEIERRKEVFIRIVHELAPAVVVRFEDTRQGRYRILFLGRRSTSRVVPEEDLADLANNGARRPRSGSRSEKRSKRSVSLVGRGLPHLRSARSG